MLIKIIAIGKIKDRALAAKCQTYLRRLGAYGKVELVELPDSDVSGEGAAVLRELSRDRVCSFWVLSEEGREFSSIELSRRLADCDRKLVFLVGGPYGIADEVKRTAECLWSLSKLTFPHEIARLLLCEQLYRAMNLAHGGAYHHQ